MLNFQKKGLKIATWKIVSQQKRRQIRSAKHSQKGGDSVHLTITLPFIVKCRRYEQIHIATPTIMYNIECNEIILKMPYCWKCSTPPGSGYYVNVLKTVRPHSKHHRAKPLRAMQGHHYRTV